MLQFNWPYPVGQNEEKYQLVRGTGLEPAHPFRLYHLKVACLPFHHPRIFRIIIDLGSSRQEYLN